MSHEDMDELSPAARALIDDVRDLDGPGPADRARVKRALVAAVASGATVAASSAASSAAAAAGTGALATGGVSLGVKLGVAALLAAAVGGTALVVTQPAEEPAPRAEHRPARARFAEPAPVPAPEAPALEPAPAPAEALEDTPIAGAPVEASVVEAPAAPDAPSPALEPTPRVRRVPATPEEVAAVDSTLSEELVLLREAQRAMQADQPAVALSHLDAHARRFPSGILEEEREAARVLALCRAERVDEARALARRFLAERPRSPHRARVHAACP
ncbi:MAG: hypothetical protein KF729_30020 [Sandaracinaceae bacterium]|nr:hypothetical protein [Sandaracinaceae bacterium]